MDVDRPRLPVGVIAPQRLQQRLPAEDPSWARGQRAQQLELDVRQLHRRAAHLHRPAGEVEDDAVGADHVPAVRLAAQRCPAEERPDAAPELTNGEGLRDVVVRPQLEADHLVQLVVSGREHDDRHGALGAQPPAHLEPVELREHEVEDDEVDPLRSEPLERLLAVPRLHDAEAVPLERIGEELLHGVLVVDKEDGRGVWRRRFHVELGACRIRVLL